MSAMNPKQTLSKIQKLSGLYVERSIESCDSRLSLMCDLKDNVQKLLSTQDNCYNYDGHVFANPQLASLAAHLLNSFSIQKTLFDHFIIIGGVGRSGTTAFGNTLNNFFGRERDFFIFTERYIWKLPYSPSSFLYDFVFCDDARYSKELIGQKFGDFVDDAKTYKSINVIGDKRPGASYMLEVNDLFFSFYKKKLLYLHLYRDPVSTALSWERRASDKNDRWPNSWGQDMMAKHYISQSKTVLEYASSSSLGSTDIKFVDYDRFFFDEAYCAKSFDYIKDALGLSLIKSFHGSGEVAEFIRKNREFAKRKRSCDERNPCIISSPLIKQSCDLYRRLLADDT